MIEIEICPILLKLLSFLNQYSNAISLIVALIGGGLGGGFALCQWRKSIKVQRADFIGKLLEKIIDDKDLQETRNLIDYEQQWYNKDFHNNSELERSIDKLFRYMDHICYLEQTGNISSKEFKIFQYDVHRICVSCSAQAYLWNLYHFSQKNKAECSFLHIIDYGIENKLLPKDFKSNKSLYDKCLNW